MTITNSTINKTPPTDYQLIVDAHCHLGPFRNFHIPDNGIDGLIRVLDELGVDVAVIAAHAGISADYVLGNDSVLEAARRYPGRVLGYCCINPNYPGDVRHELERCFAHGIFRGIKLHPELHDNYPLDGPNYRPVFEFAAEHRLPVLSHSYFAGDGIGRFLEIARQYPQATLLLGHSGLDFGINTVIDAVAGVPNIILDVTGPLSWDGIIEELVAGVGADRIIFGSDIPFVNAPLQLGGMVFARLPRLDKEKILGRNAARIFGISLPEAAGPEPTVAGQGVAR